MWVMQQIMFKGLDRRLAEFLLAEAERTGSDPIRMTHEQIAQHISSAREAVARMLKSFSEDGLVELKRGAIIILYFLLYNIPCFIVRYFGAHFGYNLGFNYLQKMQENIV